jgi:hypothetical protein
MTADALSRQIVLLYVGRLGGVGGNVVQNLRKTMAMDQT